MVRIINYKKRETEDGRMFYVLELQGGLEMVKSRETSKYYATAKRTTIPSTFDEETCRSLIGQEMPGNIKKVETEPYEFTIKETGEVIELNHRWEYSEETETSRQVAKPSVELSDSTLEDVVQFENFESAFSSNGVGDK